MPWIKQKKNEHVCAKPSLTGLVKPDVGDIWECDRCSQQWEVREEQRDGLYWRMR